mgnify:CR=1 FL=1
MTHLSNQSWSGQDFPSPQGASTESPSSHLWRLRMELDLWSRTPSVPGFVAGYEVFPWRWEDSADHAKVLFRSFENSPDAEIIPSFRSFDGCLRLVQMVAQNSFFWSSATFLARQVNSQPRNPSARSGHFHQRDPEGVPAAVIQVMGDIPGRVNLQNIGVSEGHRGKGLGRHLLQRSIQVLRGWGISRMSLEVTEDNAPALGLYRSLGFEVIERFAKPFVPRGNPKQKTDPLPMQADVDGSPGSIMVRGAKGDGCPIESRIPPPTTRS